MDHYLSIGHPEWALSLTKSAEKLYPGNSIVNRNKARALEKCGHVEDAEAEYKKAVINHPSDDTLHAFYGGFLDDNGKHENAYIEFETSVMLDPRDGSRFINLAIQIFNRGLCRNETGEIVGPLSEEDRKAAAVPLLIRACQLDPRQKQRIVSLLVRKKALGEARAIAEDQIPEGSFNHEPLRAIESGRVRSA